MRSLTFGARKSNFFRDTFHKHPIAVVFLLTSLMMALLAVSSLLGEVGENKAWKKYQARYNNLEYQLSLAKYKVAQAEFSQKQIELAQTNPDETLPRLKQRLAEAQKALSSPEYRKQTSQRERYESELLALRAKLQSVRDKYDKAASRYEEDQRNQRATPGQKTELTKLRQNFEALQAVIDSVEVLNQISKVRLAKFLDAATEIEKKIKAQAGFMRQLQDQLINIKKRVPKILQVVLPSFEANPFGQFTQRVDRCISCHIGIENPLMLDVPQPFRTHPRLEEILGNHPIRNFGCTTCHEGKGPALEKRAAHGFGEKWEFPLRTGAYVESACRKCHIGQSEIPGAKVYNKGARMFVELGCFGCHETKGYETLGKVGPGLNNIIAKLTPQFIFNWLKNPKAHHSRTRMPNFLLSDSETVAIVAYLVANSKKSDFTPQIKYTGGLVERGQLLFGTVGCQGCHTARENVTAHYAFDRSYDFAPDLSQIGSMVNADWLADWINNPRHFRPRTKMPGLRLSLQETNDLVAYLMSLKASTEPPAVGGLPDLNSSALIARGNDLIKSYGCFGCHDIRGFENAPKVGVPLSNFGNKVFDQLFFGNAFDVPRSWEGWTVNKLKNSRVYSTEMIQQRMPDFALPDSEAVILSVFLKSLDERIIAAEHVALPTPDDEAREAGWQVITNHNCLACHSINGQGGKIALAIIPEMLKEGKTEDQARAFVPPALDGEGEKVQLDWLFGFLKNPSVIRPWFTIRMPTFYLSDDEATTLLRYFSAQAKTKFVLEYKEAIQATPEQIGAARLLMSKDYFSCYSCHISGSKTPEGPLEGWAPDFALGHQRLRYDWIVKWLKDPQKLQPGTKMPSYFLDPSGVPPDVLGGDVDRQIHAIASYLMTLGRAQRMAEIQNRSSQVVSYVSRLNQPQTQQARGRE